MAGSGAGGKHHRRLALGAVTARVRCYGEMNAFARLKHDGPRLPRQRDTRVWPGFSASAAWQQKTAAPVKGRAVSSSWYHPTSRPRETRPPLPARRDNA
jgi:hypothetical protein